MEDGRPFVFLVPPIPNQAAFHEFDSRTDLFRRMLKALPIDWQLLDRPVPCLDSLVPEFKSFIERYGAASVAFTPGYRYADHAAILVGSAREFYGFEFIRRLFFLPSHAASTREEAVAIVAEAIRGVLAYRTRMSEEMPSWVGDFQFTKEAELHEQLDQHRAEAMRLDAELDAHSKRKGALCFQSDPLVEVVFRLLRHVFGLSVESEEKRIEDAKILDDDGNIIAVAEIKGINRGFKREDVNQVDSHRERLDLTADVPGLLILNTKVKAKSLAEKDEPPHPDIIKKAVQENVLMIRTLDLLRYADLVESGAIEKEQFHSTILGESGWLRVKDGTVTVVKE
ncbi:MAG: hypothetical protein C4547_06545 [Phycisphaerales bacterium]|nr:MAG: hypothetical protein C4547_06545 [Phycisphaerales bacterium]